MEELLTDIVKEKGIADIIIDYKTDMEFVEYNDLNMTWGNICRRQYISPKFIERHPLKIDWESLCKNKRFDEDIPKFYPDRINWSSLSRYSRLSLPFIGQYIDKLNLKYISTYQELTEKFILSYTIFFKDYIPIIMKNKPYIFSKKFIDNYELQMDCDIFFSKKAIVKRRQTGRRKVVKKKRKPMELDFYPFLKY